MLKRLLLGCLIVFILGGWIFFLQAQSKETTASVFADKVVRLHILANSNSQEDQAIKYKVRNAVVTYLTEKLATAVTKADAERIIAQNEPEILAVANQVLQEESVDYSASLQQGNFAFPARTYGTLLFPAGDYDAVRILLGSGQGQNWWCVLFPPLCLIDGLATPPSPQTPEVSTQQTGQEQPVIYFKSRFAELLTGH
ncbi:MAG: stage II sporulation protein R [Sporomusaceae bacterium]|nr:stage II sporulation protein R [Sporomusaceae bacterium]